MADGTTVPAEADRYPDPIAELIRWNIAEGEVVQGIGRIRGVNRTAASPVDGYVLTDAPLPLPINGELAAKDLEPSPGDLMLAAGRITLQNSRHAFLAFPGMWPTANAANQALKRARFGTFPYERISIGEYTKPPGLEVVRYQPEGPGLKPSFGLYDPRVLPDPETFLREALGALAWVEVGSATPEPPTPPKAGARLPVPKPSPDLVEDDFAEIPAGHPAFDDVPPDPSWDRLLEAADNPWWTEPEPDGRLIDVTRSVPSLEDYMSEPIDTSAEQVGFDPGRLYPVANPFAMVFDPDDLLWVRGRDCRPL